VILAGLASLASLAILAGLVIVYKLPFLSTKTKIFVFI
jgi:hypothetical protein